MESKAYFEGMIRLSWLIVLLLIGAFEIGTSLGNAQTSKYTASTTIRINSEPLMLAAVPASVVQFSEPLSYQAQIISPVILNYIAKHYPRLAGHLKGAITISTDANNQLILVSVSDISIASAEDIANYLAQQFVQIQTANLKRQLDYYESWLQQQIPTLTSQINTLNTSIQTETQKLTVPADRAQLQLISNQQSQAFQDEHSLYNDQRALVALQKTRPLFDQAYTIIQPATSSGVPDSTPYPTSYYQVGALVIGLFVGILVVIVIEYFSPFVRHKGELRRIVGLPVLAEAPRTFGFDQTRLLQLRIPVLRRSAKKLSLLCAMIGAPAIKEQGHTVLITSTRKKRAFAALLATFVARNGQRTLLIDADFGHPRLHEQIPPTGSLQLTTVSGIPLPFIRKTAHAHLFLLSAPHERVTHTTLLDLLPELQKIFDIIIIDAPPLHRSETHLFATKVSQTLLLIKKRRDTLKQLKIMYAQCESLKLNVQGLLLR